MDKLWGLTPIVGALLIIGISKLIGFIRSKLYSNKDIYEKISREIKSLKEEERLFEYVNLKTEIGGIPIFTAFIAFLVTVLTFITNNIASIYSKDEKFIIVYIVCGFLLSLILVLIWTIWKVNNINLKINILESLEKADEKRRRNISLKTKKKL